MEVAKGYLREAQENIGKLLNGLVNTQQYTLNDAWRLFLLSNTALQFERKQYIVIAKQSVEELVNAVLKDNKKQWDVVKIHNIFNSKEHWTGWAVAGYQAETGLRFSEITRLKNIVEIQRMCQTFEGQPIQGFIEHMNKIKKKKERGTNLKICREMAGITQPELSRRSQIPFRQLKLYEQGRKDINKLPREQLEKLAEILSCEVEDMLEVTSD